VRAYADPDDQKQIDAVLLPSIEKDLRAGRVSGGRHSVDKLLAGIGPAAAPLLVTVLEDPRVPFQGLVEALERVGDQPARDRASVALIKRALASPEVPVALWRAIGSLGGKPGTNFLVQKAQSGSERDAVAATQALQQRREPSLLPMALRIAGDPKANKAVRDEMFGLVEKIGGAEAQQGLVRIISGDPTELVRYRAYEAALAVGKGAAIAPALEAFPEKASYKREDVVDFLVKDIAKLGPEAAAGPGRCPRIALGPGAHDRRAGLRGAAPLDARRSLGGPADAPAVLKLAADKGTVRGFPPGDTVGKEAARVAAILQKRVGS
jgi:HEAT repeat protein